MDVTSRNGDACASNLSAALGLVECGVRDESVERALQEGLEFCAFLEAGVAAPDLPTFSVRSLDAESYVCRVRAMPGGRVFLERLPQMSNLLAKLAASKEVHPVAGELRDYFFGFVERVVSAY